MLYSVIKKRNSHITTFSENVLSGILKGIGQTVGYLTFAFTRRTDIKLYMHLSTYTGRRIN